MKSNVDKNDNKTKIVKIINESRIRQFTAKNKNPYSSFLNTYRKYHSFVEILYVIRNYLGTYRLTHINNYRKRLP